MLFRQLPSNSDIEPEGKEAVRNALKVDYHEFRSELLDKSTMYTEVGKSVDFDEQASNFFVYRISKEAFHDIDESKVQLRSKLQTLADNIGKALKETAK